MKILAIETSCDETALSIVENNCAPHDSPLTEKPSPFVVHTSALISQTDVHEKYGGVFPSLAKREHARNLVPLLKDILFTYSEKHKNITTASEIPSTTKNLAYLKDLLSHEPELYEALVAHTLHVPKPDIDALAVTYGPGLEPALWVGINFAKALSYIWDLPIIPVNHMEGHIVSILTSAQKSIEFPAIALLISGGHTEIVECAAWTKYTILGETRDDAVGEAFDKVARMLSLPYPGGPHISKLAEKDREKDGGTTRHNKEIHFPRPMINSPDLDFSFSGLKTAVLYTIKKKGGLDDVTKQKIAREFEDAVVDVLLEKTKKAIKQIGAKTLIVAGGVIANTRIREACKALEKEIPNLSVHVPEKELATDNAVMIGMAALIQAQFNPEILSNTDKQITAQGNIRLGLLV